MELRHSKAISDENCHLYRSTRRAANSKKFPSSYHKDLINIKTSSTSPEACLRRPSLARSNQTFYKYALVVPKQKNPQNYHTNRWFRTHEELNRPEGQKRLARECKP